MLSKKATAYGKLRPRKLGDGNRYKDIVKFNSDVLTSEDDITVGMAVENAGQK